MEQNGSIITIDYGCNSDNDDASSISSRLSCPWGGGPRRSSSSENTSIAIPPASTFSFSENNRHASPSDVPSAIAGGPGGLGGGGGRECDVHEEFAAETDCAHYVEVCGGAKVATGVSVGNDVIPPRREWEEEEEEDGGAPIHPPPRTSSNQHTRDRGVGSHDRNTDGQHVIMQHKGAPLSSGCNHISTDEEHPSLIRGVAHDGCSYHNVEAATARVMALLKNVRRLASLTDETRSSLHHVIILTEESVNRSQGTLRSALRKLFHDKNIHYIDNVVYLQVDAFSGIWDDDEGECKNEEHNRHLRQSSNNIRCHRDELYPGGFESREKVGDFDWIPPESDALLQQRRRLPQIYHGSYRPHLNSNEDTTYTASLQPSERRQFSARYAPPSFVHATTTRPPPLKTTLPTVEHAPPQGQSTMLLYNPFDPIEHALQLTTTTTTMLPLFPKGMKMGFISSSSSCDPLFNVASDVHYNSDNNAAEFSRTQIHHLHDDFGVSPFGDSNDRGVEDKVAIRFSLLPAAAAPTPTSMLPKRCEHDSNGHLSPNDNVGLAPPRVICIHQRVPTESDDVSVVSSSSMPCTPMSSLPLIQPDGVMRGFASTPKSSLPLNQPDGVMRGRQSCSHNLESEMHRAISESQAAHIAHTRQQVADDIKFRRSLELASIESAHNLCVEERLLRERTRCEAELELALRQSESIYASRLEEEERIKASEEQLIADLLLRTRIEEEIAQRNEEEMLRMAVIKSLEDGGNVDEDELLADAVMKSINDSAVNPSDQDEILERVLKLSLEEKQKLDEEEEEHIRKAISRSVSDMRSW